MFAGDYQNARDANIYYEDIHSCLCKGFEEKLGSVTSQTVLLKYLNLEAKDKSALTRAVKAVFPGAELRRIRKKDCPETYLLLKNTLY